MDVRGGDIKPDTLVVQYDRKEAMAHNQRWGYREGFLYIVADPRYVLEIKGGSGVDGSRAYLSLRRPEDNSNQQWTVVPFDEE
ncbi:hypothetical protein BDF14DRAFT_1774212 [Spinellus fusiger]|nr:hypothetical protein BDF14DRAFT_1774212 [Spinellus fusiger]